MLPFAGFVIFYFLREVAANAPPALRQMEEVGTGACGLPVSSVMNVALLSGSARTVDAIFESVRHARNHIHLEYDFFESDKIGTALCDLLVQKAGEGVVVRLLLDALGSRRIGFTGGVNITDEEDRRTRPDAHHDVHLRIEGNTVRWLQTTFLEDWAYATGDNLHDTNKNLPHLMPPMDAGEIPVQIVTSGPDNSLEAIHRMHVSAIHSATHRAWLTTPYFVPDEPAMLALTSAALRGVDVRLLVPRRSDSRIVSAAARSYFGELIAAGVKVWEYKARMLHSKTLVVDDHCAMIGTVNFENRSFRPNFEVMAVVYGPALAQPLAAQFETDLGSASAVRAHRRQTFLQRLGDVTARLFSPLL